jgi:hypothetical protein
MQRVIGFLHIRMHNERSGAIKWIPQGFAAEPQVDYRQWAAERVAEMNAITEQVAFDALVARMQSTMKQMSTGDRPTYERLRDNTKRELLVRSERFAYGGGRCPRRWMATSVLRLAHRGRRRHGRGMRIHQAKRQQVLLDCLAVHVLVKPACRDAGVAFSTVYQWRRDDAEFRAAECG